MFVVVAGPSNVMSSGQTTNSIIVTWQKPDATFEHYLIAYRTSSIPNKEEVQE